LPVMRAPNCATGPEKQQTSYRKQRTGVNCSVGSLRLWRSIELAFRGVEWRDVVGTGFVCRNQRVLVEVHRSGVCAGAAGAVHSFDIARTEGYGDRSSD